MLAAGCSVEVSDEPATGTVEQRVCPAFRCGGDNSPLIAGTYFHELNMASTRARRIPSQGVALVDFTQGAVHYALHVAHGRITGTAAGLPAISGQGLTNAVLVVAMGGTEYAVRITEAGEVGYWVQPAGAPRIETYRMFYTLMNNSSTPPQDVCQNPPGELGPDTLTMAGHQHDVVVFEGERIDEDTRVDTLDSTGQWFNLGCAGGTLAKMYLTGHTIAASYDGFVTTQAERQTIIRMFSADYCGDGTPFTVQGQPLRWEDNHRWMPFLPAPFAPTSTTSVEARWTASGAACIGIPRASIAGTLANQAFPNVVPDIIKTCNAAGHPTVECSDPGFGTDGYHLVSVNP